ncbi:MAG: hypothetical protein LBI18_10810 [Planctomycetaceae bacterium]|jgi:hypothetical protein|nr:hypothetical protein [Planctomycetaceae bacterium]
MNNRIIIANPIYDVMFKPQKYPVSADFVSKSPHRQLPGAMTFFRLDFLATIKFWKTRHLIDVLLEKNQNDARIEKHFWAVSIF